MSVPFAPRRRADDFHAALQTSDAADPRWARDLALVSALRSTDPVDPRPDFVHDLRERLMAEADSALAGVPQKARPVSTTSLRRPLRERRMAAAVGSFALVGATATMAVAAQGALPGEALYPLKRALENAQAGVQGDDDSKGTTLLANATGRLDEVDELSRDNRSQDPVVISETLAAFTEQAVEASDLLMDAYGDSGRPELIDDVRVFAAESMGALRSLEPIVPRESRASLIQASQALRQIDQVALEACPTCSAVFIDQVPILAATSYDDLVTALVDSTLSPTTTEDPTGPATSKQKPSKKPENRDGGDPVVGTPVAPPVPVSTDPPTPLPQPDDAQPGSKPKNPVEKLTDALLGGGNVKGKGPKLDETVEDVVEDVEGVVENLTGLRLP